jgi:prepilin-type N-terminal cleavage/methylation domain-containing protein
VTSLDDRGLTLVEIMIALTITVLIMSVVYGSLRTAGGSLQTLSVRNQLYRSTHALLEEMSRELASAFLSRKRSSLEGQVKTYFYVEDKESYDMPQDALFFTTYGHALSMNAIGESDQSEVCYWALYSPKREELILLKREDVTLDDLTCRDVSLEDWDERYEEPPTPVATGVHPDKGIGYRLVGFQVESFGDQEDPLDAWDSDQRRLLPRRVKVTLTYQDGNENLYPFSREVLLRLQERNVTPQPPPGGQQPTGPLSSGS